MQDRREKIARIVETEGKVEVTTLSRQFGCSVVTIRSDLRALEEEGKLHRVFGGAERIEAAPALTVAERAFPYSSIQHQVKEKTAIARYAVRQISNNDLIILDDSSSAYYLAKEITRSALPHISVFTNSITVAYTLYGQPNVDLFMIGGNVSTSTPGTVGDEAADGFRNIHADKGFIGVHGINLDVGITSITSSTLKVKQAILKASDRLYVLADSTKYDGGYISVVCPISEISEIVTDDGLGARERQKAKEAGAALVLVDEKGEVRQA